MKKIVIGICIIGILALSGCTDSSPNELLGEIVDFECQPGGFGNVSRCTVTLEDGQKLYSKFDPAKSMMRTGELVYLDNLGWFTMERS